MYRKTYVEINLKNIKENVKKIVTKLDNYKYHIAVVKADSYSHYSNKTVCKIIDGGANYLAVSSLEEALIIRKDIKYLPILVLGIVPKDSLDVCSKNNISITISNLDYVKSIDFSKCSNLKVHLKVNTGMNRLGFDDSYKLKEAFDILENNNIFIEGIYTHIYHYEAKNDTEKQIRNFKEITKDINLLDIPIIHFGASGYLLNYPKLSFVNGARFGIAMYGLANNNLGLKSTFTLCSNVIQINEVNCGSTVGYDGAYKVSNKEKIAIIPIGYADGIIRKNTGRDVFINDKRYKIVGNICMDMLFVKVDDDVKLGDTVILIKDNEHIKEIAKHLDTITWEVICSIGKRVPRIYK